MFHCPIRQIGGTLELAQVVEILCPDGEKHRRIRIFFQRPVQIGVQQLAAVKLDADEKLRDRPVGGKIHSLHFQQADGIIVFLLEDHLADPGKQQLFSPGAEIIKRRNELEILPRLLHSGDIAGRDCIVKTDQGAYRSPDIFTSPRVFACHARGIVRRESDQ